MIFEHHILYFKPHCPYCERVLEFCRRNSVSLVMKNISTDRSAFEELVQVGGKSQVPCLVYGGKALYESQDIIEYFVDKIEKER